MRRFRRSVLKPLGLMLTLSGLAMVLSPGPALADDCPNAEIREAQGPPALMLPDCMAYEVVTPLEKMAEEPRNPMISADGQRVAFMIRAALEGTPGYEDPIFGDYYVSSRSSDGWHTVPLSLPTEFATAGFGVPGVSGFTSDLSRWIAQGPTLRQYAVGQNHLFEASLSEPAKARSDVLVPLDGVISDSVVGNGRLVGASHDLSRLVFAPGVAVRYLADDPTPSPNVDSGSRNQYVLGTGSDGSPTLELLARDATGKAWGGNCGAWLGGGQLATAGRGGRNFGAISVDSRTMLISARAAQAATGSCNTTNPIRVLRRVETAAGVEISELIVSECQRVAPACSLADGDDLFQGASVDGKKVYFTTPRQLVDSDTDTGATCAELVNASQGCDLYLYDSDKPLGDRLTQVSAGSESAAVASNIVGISADGSRAYFVAGGALTTVPNSEGATAVAGQPNLYVYSADDSRLSFIATLGAEGCAVASVNCDELELYGSGGRTDGTSASIVPQLGSGQEAASGGDGHVLVFSSYAPLTVDDTDGNHSDLFRYDDVTGELERVSRASSDGSDNGASDVVASSGAGVEPALADRLVRARIVSDDGRTMVFKSDDALTADDDDGVGSVFVWRRDADSTKLVRLPTRVDSVGATTPGSSSASVSLDGDTIAFQTRESLVERDRDGAGMDTYVARAFGGIQESETGGDCDAVSGGCAAPGSSPVETTPLTSVPTGSKNASPPRRAAMTIRRPSRAIRDRAARTGVLRVTIQRPRLGRVRILASARFDGRRRLVGRATKIADMPDKALTVRIRLGSRARRALRAGNALAVTVVARQAAADTRSIVVVLSGVEK